MENEQVVEQVEVPAVVETVPESVETAAAESENSVLEVAEETEPKPEKTFTQAELDEIISKRLAKEQRKWERSNKPEPQVELPPADQFESTESYVEAVIAQREAHKREQEIVETFKDRVAEARVKYPDFDQVAGNDQLKISQVMAAAIRSSEIGPEVIYHLGANPKEAERIHKLDPIAQAREIGRIEDRLSANPPTRKTSSAPAPINPIRGGRVESRTMDTTDPKAAKELPLAEWIAAEEARIRREYAARPR
jgi:hypothetical protein